MNGYTQKPNKGSLFVNKYKKHDKAPDFRGSVFIDKDLLIDIVKNRTSELVEIKLDAWKGVTKDNQPWLSLSVDTYKKPEEATAEKDPWDL
jgi:hypothetical protein